MEREELRTRQAGLKQAYRQDPATAMTRVSARATFAEPGITATVEGWAGPVRAGLHPATGGDGSDACSADMLLEALLGCAGVTLRSVATAMRIEVRSAELVAQATFDARGTLGLDRQTPVGLVSIDVVATLRHRRDRQGPRAPSRADRPLLRRGPVADTPSGDPGRAGHPRVSRRQGGRSDRHDQKVTLSDQTSPGTPQNDFGGQIHLRCWSLLHWSRWVR